MMNGSLQPVPGFPHFPSHHCVTGSLRHIYAFYGDPISEEMLLGLGAGVGFIYWHTKNSLPFLGGRVNLERPGEEGLEKAVGRCTGVRVQSFHTDSGKKAEKVLLEHLSAGCPVMLLLDMGFLPYLDFAGQEYHFGYHAVVACGYQPETGQVLLADRDDTLHPVPLESLRQARGSIFPPFPPHHTWYDFDFQAKREPKKEEIWEAISSCADGMLAAPISNLGVRGIYKAAKRIGRWVEDLPENSLRAACMNTCIMIDARGGTGGGLFRYMYGRFLEEAAERTGNPGLGAVGREFRAVGDCWQEVAGLFEQAYQSPQPDGQLQTISRLLVKLAGQEEKLWRMLKEMAGEGHSPQRTQSAERKAEL